MGSDFYLPKGPSAHILGPSLTFPIFFYSLAMRSSSWPGPRGRVRKRSRSGWQDSGDRNRRTWSWPSPSARLTCRLRQCREATAVYMYTHAQHAPRFKPCYATVNHSQGQAGCRALGFGALFRGSRCSLLLWLGQRAAGKRP